MKISRQFKINLHKVAVITLGYAIINVFIFFFNYALIHSLYSLGPSSLFDVKSYFFISLLVGLIAGVLGGVVLVSVNGRLFRRRSFKYAMLTTLTAYVLIFLLVTFVAIFVNLVREHGLNGISYDNIKITLRFVFDPTLIANFIDAKEVQKSFRQSLSNYDRLLVTAQEGDRRYLVSAFCCLQKIVLRTVS